MKCACELFATRLAALEETMYLQEKRKQQYRENAVAFCEGFINEALEKEAKKATKRSIEINFFFAVDKDVYENDCVYSLTRYQNRSNSLHTWGKPLDKDVMITYLRKHCFEVEQNEAEYIDYNGRRHKNAICLTVSVKF